MSVVPYVIFDDFNDNIFDTAKWEEIPRGYASIYERNQRLECQIAAGQSSGASEVRSKQTFTMREGATLEGVKVNIITPADMATLYVQVDEDNYYSIDLVHIKQVTAWRSLNGIYTNLRTLDIDVASGVLCIELSGGKVNFYWNETKFADDDWNLPSRTVKIGLHFNVSSTRPLACADNVEIKIPEEGAAPSVPDMYQQMMNLMMTVMMLMILMSFIRAITKKG
jgi:hypothetical protein